LTEFHVLDKTDI